MNPRFSRRNFLELMAAASLTPRGLRSHDLARGKPSSEAGSGPTSLLEPFEYDGVRLLDGRLRKQCQATRDFYFNIPNDDILLGFRKRAGLAAPGRNLGGWYGGDPNAQEWWSKGDVFNTFGQWLSGMARLSRATGDGALRQKAARLMAEWAKTIEPDGYFYYSRKPTMPHYTYEKMVCGLVDLAKYAGENDALVHLEKITDWAVQNLDRSRKNPSATDGASNGTEWYTLSENLYRASLLTGNSKYKAFGDLWRYPNYWGMFTGAAPLDPSGFHAYSHCNTLSSAAMTYAVTGDAEYLKTIVNAYEYFERTQFYATGGYGPNENLQAPDGSLGRSLETSADTFETPCGSWAGFKLGGYLMRFTGEAKYGDWLERLVYNGIGAALPMAPGGKTFYYSDYRLGGGRKVYYGATWPCCSGTYLQAVADYHNIIYFKDSTGLYVNLFVPSEVTWNCNGHEVQVEQETRFPESDATLLTLRMSQSAPFGLKFRVPGWTQGAEVEINGSKVEVAGRPGTWAAIHRTWKSGDRVAIRVPMRVVPTPIDAQHLRRVALLYGPAVLVQDQNPILVPHGSDLPR